MRESMPPLLGFNNNVRHKGRLFHIQTEDSGIRYPRVVTHLFADGGRIIKTARTDYAEHVGAADMAQMVRKLMKEQHKGMFIALRGGSLDEVVEQVCGPFPTPPPSSKPADKQQEREAKPAERERSDKARDSVAPARPSALAEASNGSSVAPLAAPATSDAGPPETEEPVTDRSEQEPSAVAEARYAAPRPPAVFGDLPSPESRSIFGEVSEKSLDEVILSYLAEDLDESEKA